MPQELDPGCSEAWRTFVSAPARSRELAAAAFAEAAPSLSRAWAGLCLAYHLARTAAVGAAQDALEQVARLFDSLGEARGADLAEVLCAYVDIVRGNAEGAIGGLERIAAAQVTSPAAGPLDRFLVYHGLALAYGRLGKLERVLQHHYANVVLLERCGSPSPLAVVLLNLSGTLGAIDDWDEAYATAKWALRRCEALDNAVLRRRAEINLALTCRFGDRMDESLERLARLRAEHLRDPGSDFALFINSAEALAIHGDLPEAARCLGRAWQLATERDPHQRANCEWIAGLIAARSRDASTAIAHLEQARQAVGELTQVHIPILPRIVEQLAGCYAQLGDHEKAFATYQRFHQIYQARLGYTTRARSFGRQSREGMLSIESVLRQRPGADAPVADELAEWSRLNEALRRALAKASEHEPEGGWTERSIERVSVEARGLGIDPRGVGSLVQSLNRAPMAASADAPVPRIQVFVLGGFEIRIDGEPVRFGRKSPARPLALLKYLAAQAGREPAETEVADALWPDQDGDAAQRSLAVNLHRLRRLLGGAETVMHRDRRIALAPRAVACDGFLFEHLLDRSATAAGDEERARFIERALATYRGDYLAGEDDPAWILPVRERLRARFVNACAAQGAMLCAAGRMAEARALYLRGLEVDASAEELCLGAMRCSLALRQPTQGIAAYRGLEGALARRPGAKPAAAIKALYGELLGQAP